MKVYIPRQEIMAITGSALLKLMMAEHWPKLDLFVRESIQNSLDASTGMKGASDVAFGFGQFHQKSFSCHLEGVTEALNKRFKDDTYNYLFVRDMAKGLRGPMHFSDKSDSKERDLQKLVYEVAKPQEAQGAGGSWGLGKTVYFRMGIGLVVYYSRIKTDTGFESRMAACLVENENSKDSILNGTSLNAERGLAWWGRPYEYMDGSKKMKGTVPITDETEIEQILSVFGLNPYTGNQTGTLILIPYADKEDLLKSNISSSVGSGWKVPWLSSVEKYLEVATRRWYAPRLNNEAYEIIVERPWLRVSVNGRIVTDDNSKDTFGRFRNLYNLAILGKNNQKGIYLHDINLNSTFEDKLAGRIAYGVFSDSDLKMTAPDNKPNPFEYIWNDKDKMGEESDGRIILAFSRGPGMVVSYETSGDWVKGIKCSLEQNEFLLIVFALNSKNRFLNPGKYETIEDYFRGSEEADHAAWQDIQSGKNQHPKVLDRIQKHIRKAINDTYKPNKDGDETKNSVLSSIFGSVLLPPEGFGKKAKKAAVQPSPGGQRIGGKNIRASVFANKIYFDKEYIQVPVRITGKLDNNSSAFLLQVVTDGLSIPLEKWTETVGLECPFEFDSTLVSKVTVNGKEEKVSIAIGDRKNRILGPLSIERVVNDGVGIGIEFSSSEKCEFSVTMIIKIKIMDSSAKVGYRLRESE